MIETTMHIVAGAGLIWLLLRALFRSRKQRLQRVRNSDELASNLIALMGVEPKMWGVGYWEGGVHLIHLPSSLIIRIDGRPRVVQPFHREFEPEDRERIESAIKFSFSMMTAPKEGVA